MVTSNMTFREGERIKKDQTQLLAFASRVVNPQGAVRE